MVRTAVTYLAVLVLTVIACGFVESAAIAWLPTLPDIDVLLTGLALNVVPSLGVGFLIFFSLTTVLLSRDRDGRWRSHMVRASSLYAICALLLAIIAITCRSPDFAEVAQLFVWPLAGAVGGILGDLLATRMYHRQSTAADSVI
jgi:hypothetical protein